LHIYHRLPVELFADIYELANYESLFSFKYIGALDLESPIIALHSPVSDLLISVKPKHHTIGSDPKHGFSVEVPVHARYGALSLKSTYAHHRQELSIPDAFWECPVSTEGERLLNLRLFSPLSS
jgi:hypothetical protein